MGDESSAGEPNGTELSVIDLDIKELENACFHLERSNREISDFLSENGPDIELSDAIQENVEAIMNKRERIAYLDECRRRRVFPTLISSKTRDNQATEIGKQSNEKVAVSLTVKKPPKMSQI